MRGLGVAACALVLATARSGAQGLPGPVGARPPSRPAELRGVHVSIDSTLAQVLRAEQRRCPATSGVDLNKLLHQATMGARHAGLDSASAAAWMEREWPAMGAARAGERLLDTIAPGGRVVRLNLRPWRDAGGTSDAVVRAFVASASEMVPRPDALALTWQVMQRLVQRGVVRLRDSLPALRGDSAVDHSSGYESACRPAYRVLTAARADSLLASRRLRAFDTTFVALGTEPFWNVAVRNDALVLRTPEEPEPQWYGPVTVRRSGGVLTWRARWRPSPAPRSDPSVPPNQRSEFAPASIELTVRPGTCSDGMSDAVHRYRATVRTPGGALKGCANRRDGGAP